MSRLSCLTRGWLVAAALLIPQSSIRAATITSDSAKSTAQTAKLLNYSASAAAEEEVPPSPPNDDSPVRLPDTATPAAGSTCNPFSDEACGECTEDSCPPRWRPFVSVEAVFLAPIYDRSTTTFSITDINGTTNYNSTGNPGLLATPRIALGVMGEKWGFVTRFWNLNSSVGGYQQFSPNSDMFSQRFLKLQTFDLEAIRPFCTCNSSNWFSFGVRFAEFNRSSSLNVYNNLGPGIPANIVGSANSGSHLVGTGLTSGLYGKKPLCGCGLSLFYGARASIIWDNDPRNFANTDVSYGGLFGSATQNNGAVSSQSADLFIGELQTGFQWDHALQCCPANAFLRVAFEYQYWNASNSGHAFATSAVAGPDALAISSARAGGNWVMNLVGFNVGTGFMW